MLAGPRVGSPESGDLIDPNSSDSRWAIRLLRRGFAVAVVSQSVYLVNNYFSLKPSASARALPYGVLALAAALVAYLLSTRPDFGRRWKPVTFGLSVLMVAAWTLVTVSIGQQVQLFGGVQLLLFAACCLAPWQVAWQAALSGACLLCCATATILVRPASPYTAYLWLDLVTAAAITLVSTKLWEKWRAALAQANAKLRAEIHEHQDAQARLEKTEASLRKALDANIDLVTIVRVSDSRYIYVTEAFLSCGYVREEVLGKSVSELSIWSDPKAEEQFRALISDRGLVRNLEADLRTGHGGAVPHLISSVVVEFGGEECVLSVARDITRLKRTQHDLLATVAELKTTQLRLQSEILERERTIAERERVQARLRDSEAKLRKVFEACPDSISINRMADWRFIDCNNEFSSIGYTRDEALAASSAPLPVWARPEQFQKMVRDLTAGGIVHNMEADLRRKDGSLRPSLVSGAIIELDGEPCAVTFATDISQLKRTERELIAAREAALTASRAKSEFLSSMSHEIRTPMNAILGMADLLSETALAPEQRRYVNTMISNSNALLDLINGILDLAKVESGKLYLEETEFDLEELVGRAAETLSVRAHEKKLELSARIMPGVPVKLFGDPMRLRQVLINLIGNAIKFTSKGEVAVTVEQIPGGDQRGCLRFSVRDTGVGIAPEKLETIFQTFTQADSSVTRKYGGSGLGLAIARRLAELMGGAIRAQSAVGEGSTFHFTARLRSAHDADPPSAQTPHLAGVRVLIVDDNRTNREILREILASLSAETAEAEDGNAALHHVERAAAEAKPFTLVLLDCRMPGMDGFECARRLKSLPGRTRPVIVMLTSDHLEPRLARLREIGIDAYVVKPVRRAELLQAISFVVGRAQAMEENPVETDQSGAAIKSERELRILYAEDSPDNRLLVEAYLKNLPYHLDIAENGEVALDKFTTGKYDLVLMDVQMPVMDGHTAVRKIRRWEQDQGAQPTPIIALTASALSEDIRDSIEAGCNTHLSKPIKKARLLTAINDFAVAAPDADGNAAQIVVEIDQEIKELVPDFLQHKRDDLSLLIGALERNDFETLRAIGHKMKGEGAGFGFQMLSDIGAALEEAARARNLKTADQQVRSLARYLDHVKVTFAEHPQGPD